MSVNLLVNLKVVREQFVHEQYVPSDHILALVESGSFTFTVDGVTYTVRAGEAALFEKGVFCTRKINQRAVIHLFRYRSSDRIFRSPHVTFKDKDRIFSTIKLLSELERGVYRDDFLHRSRLFEDIITQYEIENACLDGEGDDPIDAAIRTISNNIARKIHLPEIGTASGLSYIQFSRRFKQRTGHTPSEYIASLRLQKAKHLLSETSALIREIATLCGFENEYYFSNFFKKQTGISPSSYRDLSENV